MLLRVHHDVRLRDPGISDLVSFRDLCKLVSGVQKFICQIIVGDACIELDRIFQEGSTRH